MSIFSFQLTKATLQTALSAMEHHNKIASEEAILQISIDVEPDGVGCELFGSKMEIVVQDTAKETQVPQLFYDAFGDSER